MSVMPMGELVSSQGLLSLIKHQLDRVLVRAVGGEIDIHSPGIQDEILDLL
jgi:hypothetical protein